MRCLLVLGLWCLGDAVRAEGSKTIRDSQAEARKRWENNRPQEALPRTGRAYPKIDKTEMSVISHVERMEEELRADVLHEDNRTVSKLTDPVGELPDQFTYCVAVMTPGISSFLDMGTILDNQGWEWFSLSQHTGYHEGRSSPEFSVSDYYPTINDTTKKVFPYMWTKACAGFDLDLDLVRVVVDGTTISDTVFPGIADTKPANLTGMYWGHKDGGGGIVISAYKFTNLQVYSSLHPIEQMVAWTTSGVSCGSMDGDYLSWNNMNWSLTGGANVQTIFQGEYCYPQDQEMHIYPYCAEFIHEATQLCDKLNGKMPSLLTEEEYKDFTTKIDFTVYNRLDETWYNDFYYSGMYVSITDVAEEGKWVDVYTGASSPSRPLDINTRGGTRIEFSL